MQQREYDPGTLRFKKIKHDGSLVLLEYEKLNQNGEWDEYGFKSRQDPHIDFIKALDGLVPVQVAMCELVHDDMMDEDGPYYQQELVKHDARGVTLSYSKDDEEQTVTGVTITSLRRLNNANGPLTLNSPHKFDRGHNEQTGDDIMMSEDDMEIVFALCRQAQSYIDGKRAQMDMFAQESEEVAV